MPHITIEVSPALAESGAFGDADINSRVLRLNGRQRPAPVSVDVVEMDRPAYASQGLAA